MKQFGMYDESTDYIERPGAYGIIMNSEEKIMIVENPMGIHLPGGGQDDSELLEATLQREVFSLFQGSCRVQPCPLLCTST